MPAPALPLDARDVARTRAAVLRDLFGAETEPIRVGRYEIRGTLGAGAMGRVYDAFDPRLSRRVALKMLETFADDGVDDEGRRRALLREARSLAGLNHPNVLEVFEVGVHEGEVFMALERVDGADMRRWLVQAQPDAAAVLEVFRAAASGLAAGHEHGIVHRDFKPDNVLVGSDGRVKVADFGLAISSPFEGSTHSLSTAGSATSSAGGNAGTPRYMAPELFEGRRASPASDQYSLCVALAEAMTGSPVRSGGELAGRPLPRHVRRAITRGLSSNPADRFPDVTALRRALDPPRVPRWWAMAGVSVAATVSAIGLSTGAEASCRDVPAPSRVLIESGHRDRLAAVMQERGSRAQQTLARVDPRIDAYLAELDAGAHAACEKYESDADAGSFDAARTCVTSRMRSLEGMLGAFVEDGVDGHALVQAVADLPPAHDCGSPGPPRIAVDLAADLERARTLLRAGHPEGRTLALEVRRRAAQRHDHRTVARSDLALGRALAEAGDDGSERLRAAYFTSLKAEDEGTAVSAALALADVASRNALEFDGARVWLEHAEARHRRDPQPENAVRLALSRARVDHHADRFEPALAHTQEALSRLELLSGAAELEGQLMSTRARILAEMGRLEAAEEAFAAAAVIAAQHYGPDHPMVLAAAMDRGALAFRQGRYEDALARMQEALAGLRELFGESDIRVATTLTSIGALHGKLGHLGKARKALLQADPVLRAKLGDAHPRVATNLLNLSEVAFQQGDLSSAIDQRLEALTIRCTAFGDDSSMAAMTHNALGELYVSAGRPADAQAAHARVLEIARVVELPSSVIADAHTGLSRAIDDTDRAAAIDHLERAAEIVRDDLGEAHEGYAYVLTNLAILRQRDGQSRTALELATRAVEIYITALGPEHPYVVHPMLTAAEAARFLGQLRLSTTWAERALPLAEGTDRERAQLLLATATQ